MFETPVLYSGLTISGTATAITQGPFSGTLVNRVLALGGVNGDGRFNSLAISCSATTSLAYKVYLSFDGGTTYCPVASASTDGTVTAADTAITPATTKAQLIGCRGATHFKISRTAGSGTISINATQGLSGVEGMVGELDSSGNITTAPVGSDSVIGVQKVEQRFTGSGAVLTDTTVKSGAGFLHSLTIAPNDAAPTAGTIDVYDNTAGSGTKLFTWTFTTAVFTPFTVTLDVSFGTGLYIDFTTTADVAVFASYR